MTGVEEVPVIGLRRKIAEKMSISKRSAAHFSYFEEVDVTELESLRQHLNETRLENQPKLTYLPFIIQGLIKSVKKFPQCNAIYDEEKGVIFRHEAVHIGISTQTDDGLMVPVIKHAESRDVWDTANELMRVTSSARDKTATIDELTGSTITITSLGVMGGLGATPIINHPEVSIVSIHAARDRAVVRDGAIVVRKMMNITSSFDHRIVDGYDGALMLTPDDYVSEAPIACFFMVRDGKLITPSCSSNIVESVTRDTIITRYQETTGHQVEQRSVDRSELYFADEAFLCGTGQEIIPVTSIDHHSIGDGNIGPITDNIREDYFNIVRNPNADHKEWRTLI